MAEEALLPAVIVNTEEYFFFKPRRSASPIRSTLGPRQVKIIVSAIQASWSEIESFPYAKSPEFIPAHWNDEDQLTTKLIEILNDKLEKGTIPGFNQGWFQDVTRDAKQTTASVLSIDQMPDMCFKMVKRAEGEDRSESGLFVECKLLSGNSGCGLYVREGMIRFVDGRYASQMGFGLMLGYGTSEISHPPTELGAFFKAASTPVSLRCRAEVKSSSVHPDCFASLHTRQPPAHRDFCTFHVWLVRASDVV